nr:hypothetical protein [Nostoc sp. ZfuVER08]
MNREAQRVASPGTKFVAVTAPSGPNTLALAPPLPSLAMLWSMDN